MTKQEIEFNIEKNNLVLRIPMEIINTSEIKEMSSESTKRLRQEMNELKDRIKTLEDVKGIFPKGEKIEKEELNKVFKKEESVFKNA